MRLSPTCQKYIQAGGKPAETQGGLHSGAFLVASRPQYFMAP